MALGKHLTAAVVAAALVSLLAGCEPGGRRSQGDPNYLVVNSSVPAQGSQNAYIDQVIELHLNQTVDHLTVNPGTIKIAGPLGTVNGTYTVNTAAVLFTPDQNFSPNTSYSVTVDGFTSAPFCLLSTEGDGLQSQYLLSFSTGTQYTPDTDPPSVSAIWVSNGTTDLVQLPLTGGTVTMNISPATSVIVEFDEGMLSSSFDSTTFSLIDQTNPTNPLNGSWRFFNKNSRVVFYPLRTPTNPFLNVGTNYTLLLTASLTDDSMNPGRNNLAPAPVQVAFRTRDPIDLEFTSGAISGTFQPSETVTAAPSGATGTVKTSAAGVVVIDALTITGTFAAGDTVTGGASGAVANSITITRQPYNGWNRPSANSPYAEMFSTATMLDATQSSAIWNTGSSAQRLEGGYGAAALAGSGADGPFNPTQSQTLSTTTRAFGYNYTSINIPSTITITGAGTNPLIMRSQGDVIIDGTITVNANPGQSILTAFNHPGGPGGAGGPGGYAGGSGDPVPGVTPFRSAAGSGPTAGGGGLWSTAFWNSNPFGMGANTCKDFPGSGGGGGNATMGGPGTGSNIVAPPPEGTAGLVNTSGDPQVTGYQLSSGGGAGGGGGGGDDDGGAGGIGDGIYQTNGDEGGGGGGGGGGVVNITSSGNISITGSISARGGAGGNTIMWNPPPGGGASVGGGGGAGGTILVQGTTINIASANLDARGGAGATGLYNGGAATNPLGGTGGDGWIRLESSSGTVLGEGSAAINPLTTGYSKGPLNIDTTQGQSLFFDTGVEDPDYIDNAAGGFQVNLVLNSGRIYIHVQGAEVDSQGDPWPQTYWPNNAINTLPTWELAYDSTALAPAPKYVPGATVGINKIDRYRFFRFKVVFGNLLNVFPPGPYVMDITFPFRD